MSQKCHKNVTKMSQKCHKNVTILSQKCHDNVTKMSQYCQKMTQKCHENVTKCHEREINVRYIMLLKVSTNRNSSLCMMIFCDKNKWLGVNFVSCKRLEGHLKCDNKSLIYFPTAPPLPTHLPNGE